MTMVDKISFRFSMADEAFAKGLYADWDRFCQQCAIDIMDEFFTRYDSRNTYIEIDRLELDLGGISQKDFYEEFPLRLRKVLERNALPYLSASGSQGVLFPEDTEIRRMQAFAQEKRFENLLHYLEYGFCLPEWACIGFDPEEELRHLDDRKMFEQLLALITKNPNASERFFTRAHDELLAAMLPGLLLSPVPGQAGKQRYMATSLERMPHAVLRFIHETKETGSMENMALLLENPLVRQIMTIETENHAEIDVPEYWYGLYGWLLEFYPFNGVLRFGDKQHFKLHLNRSLLSFIRRRSSPSYLSKAELTMQFLMEVFGSEHCFSVLDTIYHNQRLNPDGTPASGDSYVWEIYYMLLQLSMIRTEKQPNRRTEDLSAFIEHTQKSVAGIDEWLKITAYVSEEGSADQWADILQKDTLLAVATRLNGIPSEILAKAINRVEASVVGMNLFTGSSAELNRSFSKALILLIAGRPDLTSMGDVEVVHMFISYWRLAVIGQKEIPTHDREKWERLERNVTEAVVEQGMDCTGFAQNTVTKPGEKLLEKIQEDAHECLLEELVSLFLSPAVGETRKSQLLRHYARWQPALLWKLIRYSSVEDGAGKIAGRIPFRQWSGWLGTEACLEMVSGLSLSLGETLRQTNVFLSARYHIPETALAEMSVRFIAGWRMEQRYDEDASGIIRRYVAGLGQIAAETGCLKIIHGTLVAENGNSDDYPSEKRGGQETIQEVLSKEIETVLYIEKAGESMEETMEPDYIEVPDAGLCLLALWLPRLFGMLGLLSENSGGKKDLKDTGARIRAIFILQRLVTNEKKEYKEQELAFNRILAGCPFQVSLPKTLELTENEIQTVESMLAGVKVNWNKLKNTSIKGFQCSFIERPGRLEQREEKWVLYVEERAYDILLDSLPWSYRQIRLPWLKKKVCVVWRDKEEYDFGKL